MYKSKGVPDDGAGGGGGSGGSGGSGGGGGGVDDGKGDGQFDSEGARALEVALLDALIYVLYYVVQSTAPDSAQERAARGHVAMACVEYFASRLKPYHRVRPAPKPVVRLVNKETAARCLNEANILLTMLREARLDVTNTYLDTNADYRAVMEAYEDIDRFIEQTVCDLTFVVLDDVNRAAQLAPLDELDSLIATTERMVAMLKRIVN